ncbi:cation diffusion facilitator family transporter [Metabacillus litoralis]|uniref:cation diffusion facilitator family transporter n=1 Tax=Metabacillus TaxID=2675233 RepID=UPI000EF63113|nr:cation diffusion facilitator family transporter [Metabacillus litoralis]MCM3163310.1 cation diffusion facilitator family transporter [Metabacillus litoralis]MCM3409510.1 cation diffusion facilitator family transporter [Metabacillus litoralis]UHA58904.1 cation diffusion facilitator family transporter [Metabacillus litoralis]
MENTNLKKAEKGVWISIAAYVFLSTVKLISGYMGNSDALKADGLNNLTDVIASVTVLVGLRFAQKPADENHKYGHSRAETIASLIASIIMFTVGIQVIVDAFNNLRSPAETTPQLFTAFVALFCAIFMFFVYRYNRNLSKKLESKALYAASQDNRSDALVSIGAVIGIVGAYLGWGFLDPIVAGIVGLIIIHTAYGIFKEAVHDLTDGYDAEKLKEIEETIKNTPGVTFVKDIKARVSGNQTTVDAIVFVKSTLSVVEGHGITDKIEERLRDMYNIERVHIHIEPH